MCSIIPGRNQKTRRHLLIFFIMLTIVYLSTNRADSQRPVTRHWIDLISQVSLRKRANCSDLFTDNQLSYYPESYLKSRRDFNKHLREVLMDHNVVGIEGHSGQLLQQQMFYWHLATDPSVKTVCEIGFNAGHSALLWLSANEHLSLYSFDINHHRYTKPMAEYIQARFPKRFAVIYGPSIMTVPVVAQLGLVQCDICVVDGAHTKDMAMADIFNMRMLAHDGTLLVIDDTAKDVRGRQNEVEDAVENIIKDNVAEILFECSYHNSTRGFTFMTYNK